MAPEFLLDLDPEDHEEATWPLAFDYVALADYDAFDEVINDVSDKYPESCCCMLWSEYRRHGRCPPARRSRLRTIFRILIIKESHADSHPADDAWGVGRSLLHVAQVGVVGRYGLSAVNSL